MKCEVEVERARAPTMFGKIFTLFREGEAPMTGPTFPVEPDGETAS